MKIISLLITKRNNCSFYLQTQDLFSKKDRHNGATATSVNAITIQDIGFV
jgi:hypothetical protein